MYSNPTPLNNSNQTSNTPNRKSNAKVQEVKICALLHTTAGDSERNQRIKIKTQPHKKKKPRNAHTVSNKKSVQQQRIKKITPANNNKVI